MNKKLPINRNVKVIKFTKKFFKTNFSDGSKIKTTKYVKGILNIFKIFLNIGE